MFLIYPFRLARHEYQTSDIKSVFRQLNNVGRVSYRQTFVYFGLDRRVVFNSYQIMNYNALGDKFETLDESAAAGKKYL